MSELHPSTVAWLDQSIAEVSQYSDHNRADIDAARAVIHLRRLRDFVREQGVPSAPTGQQPSRFAYYC